MSITANGAASAQVGQHERAQRKTAPLVVCLSRLADLVAQRANIAVEEAECLADLARIVDIELAGSADQSVSALVTNELAAPKPREYMSQAALADMLDTHPRTIRRMELAGEIPPAVELGRLKRWRRSEIQDWLDNGRPKPRKRTR